MGQRASVRLGDEQLTECLSLGMNKFSRDLM